MDVDDTNKIIEFAMECCHCESESMLAKAMNMSAQNFNQKKKRGTIGKQIKKFLKSRGINVESTKPPPAPSWELKALLESMQKQIDSLQSRVEQLERCDRLKRSG